MQLELAGWNEFWAIQFKSLAGTGLLPARILAQHRHVYSIFTEAGESQAEVAGALLHRAAPAELPVVGDWVALRAAENAAIIHEVLPRRTRFSRRANGAAAAEQVMAANIDLIFVVCGLDQNYNLRRLERYLVAASESGASVVIVLNKADLCPDIDLCLQEVRGIAPGLPIATVSAIQSGSADVLLSYIGRGQTAALVGSSGVGKSTIVNQLLASARQMTQATREADGRGRHTTTHRELFFLRNGGLVLDSPGIRELQLWPSCAAVEKAFPEIEALAESCAFRDCRHQSEPRCAIQAALESGELDEARWRSYLKLQKELRHAALEVDEHARRKERERIKKLCKDVKRGKQRW